MTENDGGVPPDPQPNLPQAHQHQQAPGGAQYGYPVAPPKNDLGVWALVTGILSYVMCPLVLGIAAIITGTKSRHAADEGLANNRGMGTAGLILGWVNVALTLLGFVLVIFLLGSGLLVGGIERLTDLGDLRY